MPRAHLLCFVAYAPHLLDEHLAGMWNDPLVVRMFAPLEHLEPRQSAYLIFQGMFALSLGMTYLVGRGGRAARLVLAGLALALVSESHHLVRALHDGATNVGFFTSLPMPIVGLWLFTRCFKSPSLQEG